MKNRNTNYIFYHTPHKVIRVEETIVHRVRVTKPLSVSYTKLGMITEEVPDYNEIFEQKNRTKVYFQNAPRLTFAGKIVPMTENGINSDMVEIHIGASMTKGSNSFNKKKGRSISSERANSCPLIIIQCLTEEVHGVFHKTVTRLAPVITDVEILMCNADATPVEKMSLMEILSEEHPE